MAEERLRLEIDEPYLVALGTCLFVFASLEWNVVWCGEKIAPGFLTASRQNTAGRIAADFEPLAARVVDGIVRTRCIAASQEFRRLVHVRNAIMHAQPCTAPSGEQRLVREENLWTVAELEAAADQFATCSIKLNDLFHHWMP
jgi:hypothetical protein